MKRGRLVTFEGIEGCGKSTQLQKIGEWLAGRRIPFVATREPGGTEAGAQIRKILLSEKTEPLTPLAEAMLYMADRFQHIAKVIRPKLEAGALILCDRYHDSTVAYQGYARGLPLELLDSVWRTSNMSVEPDMTVLLDIDPQAGIERSLRKLQAQNLDESRFEKEALEFHARVRAGFLDLAKRNPQRFVTLDGAGSADDIHQVVIGVFQKFLERA